MGVFQGLPILPFFCCLLALTGMPQRSSAFVNNPKIITKDGNLIIESGLNRNISFKLNGKARLMINDEWDLLALLQQKTPKLIAGKGGGAGSDSLSLDDLNEQLDLLRSRIFGEQGFETQNRQLQNITTSNHQLLRRYRTRLNALDTRVKTLSERLELDNCKSSPCENGGTCYNMYNSFMCKCTQNFEGAACERDVNECALYAGTDLGCQNGAQCVNQFGGYGCLCTSGWYGIHCTQHKDCTQSSAWELCGHGTCVSSNDDTYGYKCICDQGWKTNGLTPGCTVDVNECEEASHPHCATRCINLPGSFMCGPCDTGLTGNGMNCRDIDECALNNGGCSQQPRVACINTYGGMHCGECPLGWTGDGRTCTRSTNDGDDKIGLDDGNSGAGGSIRYNCADANICYPQAKCAEIGNTVVCTCPDGMVGSGVGHYGCAPRTKLTCNALPCLNGGTCIDMDEDNGYTCLCPMGFHAPNCAPGADPCARKPCANNGICKATDTNSFQCNCMPGYTDRLCKTTMLSLCGGIQATPTGRIQYPSETASYEHNSQCAWVLRTTPEQVLNVTFDSFELEDSTECRSDWLQINDGRTAAAQVIGRFCGKHKPLGGNIISSTNELYLWFRSDNSTAKAGFTLLWNSIQPQCGGPVEFTTHGTVASPGSPGQYPKNRDCRWHLVAPNNKRIKLTFFSLHLETHDTCNYDYLEIIDALSGNELVKYCTSTHPEPLLLATNEILMHFHTDSEGSDTGFQIYYSAEERIPGCGGTYTARQGAIKSPAMPNDPTVNSLIACEYDIRMTGNESIIIEFVSVSLGPDDCLEFYDIDAAHQVDILQDKYCGSHDYQAPTLKSLYNAVRIKYYAKAGSFELRYRADCSYLYTGESGVIMSPNYPQLLPSAERTCTYTIRSRPGTILSLHAVDFNMRPSSSNVDENENCLSTSLTILHELKTLGGPYCDNRPAVTEMMVDWNSVRLVFQTAGNGIGRGFKYEFRAIPIGENNCGGLYTELGHTIRLPTNEDGEYNHEITCYWVIQAPVHKGIALTWKSFSVESSSDCTYDKVEIYDKVSITNNDPPLGRYCGLNAPPAIVITSNVLLMKFQSDMSDALAGFEATYEFVDVSKQCGGDILSSSGVLRSPAYPANYTNGIDCTWTLTAPQGTQIELLIDMFELEATPQCTSDWLEVRNGAHTESTLVGSFCGTAIPRRIPSFTNQMRVHFHSDSFVNARGFKIQWAVFSNGCGGNLIGDLGVITSPNYPHEYPNYAQCEWLVQVKKGSAIQFTIEDIRMEDLYSCNYDHLDIFDGRQSNMPKVQLCSLPNEEPRKIDIDSSEALIRFVSDASSTDGGFMLSYRANCTRTISDPFGIIESPNYGDPFYTKAINCAWTIAAPKGNHIALEINYMDRQGNEVIYFTERDAGGAGKNAKNITRVIRERGAYNTSGDTLTIMQNSSAINFRLEFMIEGCVQRLHRNEGGFVSPNHPLTYPNDVECLWEIHTQVGNRIELRVSEIDIEETVNCTKDALIISSQSNSHNPKERYCGKYQDDLVITSNSHRMYVRFASDGQNNAKGFTAKYTITKSTCGGEIQSRNGIITSPNYPLRYPPDSDCEWSITVSPHHTVTLRLEELDLEEFYECEMDFVEGYEASDSSEKTPLLFHKCGTLDENEANTWSTETNKAIVRFHTDNSVQTKGFKLSYEESCGQRVMIGDSDAGYIEMMRSGIVNNQTCVWRLIAVDRSKHILLTVSHVQLSPLVSMLYPMEGDCIEKGVKIHDGIDVMAPVSHKFCMTHPPDIISNGHALTISVPFNVISEFEAVYSLMDGWCGGLYLDSLRGRFTSPSYPGSYAANLDCEWFLQVSPGNAMTLTIESMSLEQSDQCNKDYLEVREADSRGRVLGVYCGGVANIPGPIVGSSGLWVKFSSDDNIVDKGFMASYNYATHNELNGTSGVIQSPRYPSKFHGTEPYSWRISAERNFVVQLSIKHIVDTDMPFIKFYDGYTHIGAPIDYANRPFVRTQTSSLYIMATRGPFEFEWEVMSKEAVATNETAARLAEQCGTVLVSVNTAVAFKSPGYPSGYATDLNCSWTLMATNPGRHVVLRFTTIDLEVFQNCNTDYVRVSTSNNMQRWRQLASECEMDQQKVAPLYHGKPYLKLDFITDSSINKTGFVAQLSTECGSELSDRAGLVNITSMGSSVFQMSCVWTIRVRQGRRVRLTFPESYLRSADDATCRTFFMVRNGKDEDSPFLGRGKFCENNISEILETTSNRAYVRFVRFGFPTLRAAFHYEEIGHDCSEDIALGAESIMDSMKTINSPQYPNIPNPHMECLWRITAPQHHVIAIDFIDRFEMVDSAECAQEYVELHDGATDLMPSLGRFCAKRKPNRRVSSNNVLRVHYFNDLSEPHVGFRANVSIARCGGFYFEPEGVIDSPSGLRLTKAESTDFECVYTIEMERGHTINLTMDTINLPAQDNCSLTTHLELQEFASNGSDEFISDTLRLCGGDGRRRFIVETNKVVVRFKIIGVLEAEYSFRFSYNSIGTRCGEAVVASRGILQTPNYPDGVMVPTQCFWHLTVPKGRRVKIEVLDFDTGAATSPNRRPTFAGRLTFANDFDSQSIITRVLQDPPTAPIYSTDNTMGISAFIMPFNQHRGFKLRFSSDESNSECQHISNNNEVHMVGKNTTAIYCRYYADVKPSQTLALHVSKLEHEMPQIFMPYMCKAWSPLKLEMHDELLVPDGLCKNETFQSLSLRMPFPVTIILSANNRNRLSVLDLNYQLHKCGGLLSLEYGTELTITQPKMEEPSYNDRTLECAWLVGFMSDEDPENMSYETFEWDNIQLVVTLSADLKGSCENHYLLLYNGPDQNSPTLGRYCGQATASNLIVEHGLFFEYFTSSYERLSRFNVTAKLGSGCGGTLHYPYREVLLDEQYVPNAECIWDVIAESGYYLSITFVKRFFIEASTNCTKDYLLVQERVEDSADSDEWRELKRLCGREPPDSVNTTTSRMRIIFRSDNETRGDGFIAHFSRHCGGTFHVSGDEQELYSPGYPSGYEHNLTCQYEFLPQKADVANVGVLVRFLDFDLEAPPINKCLFDNVTVSMWPDEYSDPEIEVLCGANKTWEFRAKHRLTIVLRTDNSFSASGFHLSYTTAVCGGRVTNTTTIISPRQNGNNIFPHNSECFWNLTAPEGNKILVKFEHIDFEDNSNCAYDGIEVFRGLSPAHDARMSLLCGNFTGRQMPYLTISQNTGLVRSFSDHRDASVGFRALIAFKPNCDRNIYLGVNNATYDFNLYANSYAANLDCEHVIMTKPGRQLLLRFYKMHMEASEQCDKDYLEIRDGGGSFAESIAKLCGHEMPQTEFMTSRNALYMRFVSDVETTSSGVGIHIESVPLACGQHDVEVAGSEKLVIRAPLDTNGKYLKNLNCFWRIRSDKNIHVHFAKLDLDVSDELARNRTCGADYLKLYSISDADIVEKGYGNALIFNGRLELSQSSMFNYGQSYIYCGKITPADHYFTGKEVYVRLHTDNQREAGGFELIATAANGCYHNFTGTNGRIFVADTTDHCDIYITAPANQTLSLYYAQVIFALSDCNETFIEVFDAPTNTSLQRICQYSEPGKSLFTNSSALRLNIKMNQYYSQIELTYVASTDGIGCGGSLYNTRGIITSPHYPENRRENSLCRWHIRVPNNLVVLLKFNAFDLGAKSTCHSDYLQIIEYDTDATTRVARQFCGDDHPTTYTSTAARVTVYFHKTENFDGTGWVISYAGVEAGSSLDEYHTSILFS